MAETKAPAKEANPMFAETAHAIFSGPPYRDAVQPAPGGFDKFPPAPSELKRAVAPACAAIYPALKAICAEMGGLAKTEKNKEQGWKFRSVEAALAKLKPLMDAAGVYPEPRVLGEPKHLAVTSGRGTAGWRTTLMLRVRWRSSVDGSHADTVTAGEAVDYSDKATNKAMTAAWKYAIMLTFACQFEDEEETDKTSPDAGHPVTRARSEPAKPSAAPRPTPRPPAPAQTRPAPSNGARYSQAAEAAGLEAL